MAELETRLIGKRMKFIRYIINEGGKLSVEQLAFLLGETGDRLRNYELGRAALPNRLLQVLYERGFNITYIITGEGELFASNEAGIRLKKILQQKRVNLSEIWAMLKDELQYESLRNEELKRKKLASKEALKQYRQTKSEEEKQLAEQKKKNLMDEIPKAAAGDMYE